MRLWVSLVLLAACGKPAAPEPLAELRVPDLPLWTNKYADTREEFGVFFHISTLMERYALTRIEAVEVQNHVRDQRRADPKLALDAAFDEALRRVRAGELESGVDAKALDAARFVVVFDLDETLYDQYYSADLGAVCHSLAFDQGGKTKHIQLAPGWAETFAAVRELGGAIVLFSANLDDSTRDNLAHWQWEGRSVLEHPDIGGVLTNSYLVMQHKDEGQRQNPVVEPSKDLRLFDSSLRRAIIVDDNPRRLFQYANARVTRKFHADEWCNPDTDPAFKAALGGELAVVQAELRDSVAWLDAHPTEPFQRAYLPYTIVGRVAVDALVASNGWSRAEAVAFVRAHPEASDSRF